jgi:hypothetical protein
MSAIIGDEENELDIRGRAFGLLSLISQYWPGSFDWTSFLVFLDSEHRPVISGTIFLLSSVLFATNGGIEISDFVVEKWKVAVREGVFDDFRSWRMCLIGLTFLLKNGKDLREEWLLAVHAFKRNKIGEEEEEEEDNVEYGILRKEIELPSDRIDIKGLINSFV